MLETMKVQLTGVSPLLMRNGQLCDPLSAATKALKEVSKVKTKTDEHHAEIMRLEWLGSLYLDEKGRPSIPGTNILSMIVSGAKKTKRGKQAKAGVFDAQAFYPLIYSGPKDLAKLFEDERFRDVRPVRVGMSRVMRCRPRFAEWALELELLVSTDIMEVRDVLDAIEAAGVSEGLGDDRPRHGRFTVKR